MTHDDCVFCKIISGVIPVKRVFEDDSVIAFNDHAPSAPVHILIVPKVHFESLEHLASQDLEIMEKLTSAIQKVTRQLGVAQKGYRTIINTGKEGGQTVFHLHVHILAGKNQDEKLTD